MSRDIPVGNGSLLINFDKKYGLRDLYYPAIGKENHTGGHGLRFGVWVEGKLEWTMGDWGFALGYVPESLVTRVEGTSGNLRVHLLCHDLVDYQENIYLKKIVIKNLEDRARDFRFFFYHDLHILEHHTGDTAYYDPDEKALIHYKADRYFLMSGLRNNLQGIDQFATGIKEFRGLEGTWRDAEDGLLEGNSIAQGSVDSTMSLWLSVGPQEEKTLYYWLAAGKNFAEVSRLNRLVISRGPDYFITRTENYWRAWVNKEDFNLEVLPERVIDLFKKSLLILRTNIDAGGAIIAANDASLEGLTRDTYSYMWPRDGAFTAYALDLAGNIGVTRKFYEFCFKIIAEGKETAGFFLHKYQPNGSLGSSWHPWTSDGEKQLPIQEDSTGLVLWSLWFHFNKYRDLELMTNIYETLVYRCGDFLASYRDTQTGLPLPSYDLWEETWGIHTFTVSAVYAGLTAAANFASFFGLKEKAKYYRQAAQEVKEGLSWHLYSVEHKRFLRKIAPRKDGSFEADLKIDASLYAPFYFGVFEPRDERVVNTMTAIQERLWIKSEIGGIARYEDDGYHRRAEDLAAVPGNPWFICTLWLAQWQIAKAENLKELQEAVPILEWVAARALPSGVLAEQVHPYTGEPLSASPLTWSHAAYVATFVEYMRKMEEVYLCPRCGRSLYRHDRGGRTQHKGQVWRKVLQAQEQELGHPLTFLKEGEVEYQGRRATISVDHNRCVGAPMCAFTCPVEIFEVIHDKAYLVKENLPKCLLHTCMNCRNNCPSSAVQIKFHGLLEGLGKRL